MSNEGTVVRVDPATLIVAANVRSNTKVTKEFVASVKLHGVLVPITAQEAEDGLRVVDGQRRTLAAVEAGLKDVPVFVVAPLEDAARIVDQVVVNEHRAELDDVEQVLAMKELEQLGVSAAAIARRTGAKRKTVDAALLVAGSEPTNAVMRDRQLTLDDALLLAEFADDESASKRLLEQMTTGRGIEHLAQRIREERHTEEQLERIRNEIREKGLPLLEQAPAYDDKDLLDIAQVDASEGGEDLDPQAALAAAPHDVFAFAKRTHGGWGTTDGEYKQLPDTFSVGYAVKRSVLAEHGWWHYSMRNAPVELSAEEQVAAKEERRRGREATKAWAAATSVRVAWLQQLLQRKAMPKGWELLSVQPAFVNQYGYPWGTVLGLLGIERSENGLGKYDLVKYVDEHPTRAPQVAVALALGAVVGCARVRPEGLAAGRREVVPRAAGVVGLRALRRRARGSGCRSGAVNQLRRHQARFRRDSTSQRVSKPMTVPTAAPMSVTDASASMEAWAASSFVIRSSGAPHRRSAAMSLLASIKRTTRLDGYASEPRCSIIASAWRLTLSIAARTASILRLSSRSSAPRRSTRSVAATPTMVPEIPAAYVAQSLTGFTVSGACLV
jgi:ParB family chromosome partitioning protein